MVMKGISFLCCMALMLSINASAQYKLSINNTQFNLELNDNDMSAAIRDYNYVIEDAEFPYKPQKREFYGLEKDKRTVEIPSTYTKATDGKEYTITTIGKAAFAGFTNVDYIIIPSTVTTIEDYAFFRSSVISIEIPASVTHIGNRAFGWCKKLKSLRLPQGIREGKNLCSESKDVKPYYYTSTLITSATPNKNVTQRNITKKPVKQTIATSSDVDIDLPQTSKENEDMFAVIIANENYLKVEKVDCALRDGRTFYQYCLQVLGIPKDHVHIVEDATSGMMTEELDWLAQIAQAYEGDSKIIVYYAGHGIPNEKSGAAYLLPVDASGNNTSAAYSLNNLYNKLGKLNSKNVTLFLDACFSGSLRGEGMLAKERGIARAYKPEAPSGNMVVFTASQGNETAYPYAEKGHGLFTYYLLKKLKESKGNVSYGELGDYIHKEVKRRSIVSNRKSQTPTVSFSPAMSNTWRDIKFK